MNGAQPPQFDEKAAEDLFAGLQLSPQAAMEIQKAQIAHEAMNQRLQRLAGVSAQQMNLQSQYGQLNLGGQGVAHCMPQAGQAFPNLGGGQWPPMNPPPPSPYPPQTDQQAQDHAITMMNPIARGKFEPIFKLLEIKLRHMNRLHDSGTEWVVQKAIKDGRQIRLSWSTGDPGGGSFKFWSNMVGDLLDQCAKLEGNDVSDNNDTADTESAGSEVPSSSGNP